MALKNPITWVSEKIDQALTGAAQEAKQSVRGMHPKVEEAMEILSVNASVTDEQLAAVLNLSLDAAVPIIESAKRRLLKEALMGAGSAQVPQTSVTEADGAGKLQLVPEKTEVLPGEPVKGT